MIVSTARSFLYIHIPRTGGSSFTRNYRNYIDGNHDGLQFRHGWQHKLHLGGMHSTYMDHKRHIDNSDFISFAFVRNPWSWVFSWYTVLNPKEQPSKDGLKRFIKNPNQSHWTLVRKQQADYICDHRDHVCLDMIFRYERYDLEIKIINETFKMVPCEQTRLNGSLQGADYRNFYTEETKQLVRELYPRDVKILGYTFEGHKDDFEGFQSGNGI